MGENKRNFEPTSNNAETSKSSAERITLEAALKETKFGKFNYFLIAVSGTILSAALFETLGISFVLPVSDCDLNLTTEQKGVLGGIGFLGIVTSSHLWGFLADTKGRRKTIRLTLQITFLTSLISSFLNDFRSLVIVRFLNGFFVSGGAVTILAYLGEFHVINVRSKVIMEASVIYGFSIFVIPALAWLVINHNFQFYIPYLSITYKPWRLFLVVCGLPGLVSALCLYFIPESPKFTLLQNRRDETIETLKKIYAINTGRNAEEYPCRDIYEEKETDIPARISIDKNSNLFLSTLKSMWRQTIPLFQGKLLRRTIIACVMQFFIYAISDGVYMRMPEILDVIGEYRKNNANNRSTICEILRTKLSNSAVSNTTELLQNVCKETLEISSYQYSAIIGILYALSYFVIGFIINAVGKIRILVFILVGCGVCGIAIAFVTVPVIAIYLFVIFMLCGLSAVIVSASTVDLYPTSLRAIAVCITHMMGRVGSMVGANVFGLLLDYNCSMAFLVTSISLIITGFIGFIIE